MDPTQHRNTCPNCTPHQDCTDLQALLMNNLDLLKLLEEEQ